LTKAPGTQLSNRGTFSRWQPKRSDCSPIMSKFSKLTNLWGPLNSAELKALIRKVVRSQSAVILRLIFQKCEQLPHLILVSQDHAFGASLLVVSIKPRRFVSVKHIVPISNSRCRPRNRSFRTRLLGRRLPLSSQLPNNIKKGLFDVDAILRRSFHEFATELPGKGLSFLRRHFSFMMFVTFVADEHDWHRPRVRWCWRCLLSQIACPGGRVGVS